MAMDRTAFLFPGQGSQTPGMGAELTHERYRTADELLGLPLTRLCAEGTADELRDTAIAQPAILLTSLVALENLRDKGIEPAVVAGHSVGEYTALVAAGVLEWTDALRLVHLRGRLMADVGTRTRGGMVAVLGIPAEEVTGLCEDIRETVEVANYNAPQQTVLAGTADGIAAATARARALGADVVALKVAAPFHCGLMHDIEGEFGAALAEVSFAIPKIPVLANVTADYVHTGEEAADLLRAQLCAPVRWREIIDTLVSAEVTALVEVGPGRVLTNINRATAPEVPAMAVGTARQLATAVGRLTGR